MKFLFSLFIIGLSFRIYALEIVVNVPALTPEIDEVFLTGNFPGVCYWESDCIRLEKVGANNYSTRLKNIEVGNEFKITRGSWQTQAASSSGEIYSNFKIRSTKSPLILNIPNWADQKIWGVKGKVFEFEKFYSPELENYRNIFVWVPTGYENSTNSYQVIYMHDGQNLFDRTKTAFGNEWGIDEILTDMVSRKLIEPAIVVGVSSTNQRNAEYTYLRKGKKYADFLIKTLKPFIDEKFRTKKDREFTSLMGSSMGALISFTILWNHSDVFSRSAALSLPVFAHDSQVLKFLKKYPQAPEAVSFYMDHGGQGQDANYQESAQKFSQDLVRKYGLGSKSLIYRKFPWADHTEVDWSRRVNIPLKILLK